MTTPLAFLFPGQNSRYPAMIEKLLSWDRANEEIIELASDTLGRDLKSHFRADNPNIFAHNRDVQVGVFLANHMHWQTLERAGIHAHNSAGLSLGEYNHLVHIGALEVEDALRILTIRGDAYEAAPRGMMAAVYPVSADEAQAVVVASGFEEKLAIAMCNTPHQCVLSGERTAVEYAMQRLEQEFFVQITVIEDHLPMHSPLFRQVTENLRPALEAIPWYAPARPYLPNVKGTFMHDPSRTDLVDALANHPSRPVLWKDSMETLLAAAHEITVVETGPKSVLTGFFSKRWLNPPRYSTDSKEDFGAHIEELIEDLGHGITTVADAK
jgi:[acyl-carrier-protein] S-malonyltransferase